MNRSEHLQYCLEMSMPLSMKLQFIVDQHEAQNFRKVESLIGCVRTHVQLWISCILSFKLHTEDVFLWLSLLSVSENIIHQEKI